MHARPATPFPRLSSLDSRRSLLRSAGILMPLLILGLPLGVPSPARAQSSSPSPRSASGRLEEPPRHRLSYGESSTGLTAVSWEGGDTELELGDLDGDGNPDLVTIGDHGNPLIQSGERGLMTYFGDGTGSWVHQQTGNFGYGGIAVGDVNNDGLLDVGYGMHHNYSSNDFGDQLLEVALGDGTGMAWTPWDDNLGQHGQSWGMFATDFADIDNDGDLDIASNSFGFSDGLFVYRNEGDGTWTPVFSTAASNADPFCVFGDVDGDGNADLAVARAIGTVWRGDGAGSFTKIDGTLPPGSGGLRTGVDLGDVDLDGDDELAFAGVGGGPQVWSYDGGQSWSSRTGNLPETSPYRIFQICDMDADGLADLVGMGSGRFQVWLGDGAGGWTAGPSGSSKPGSPIVAFRTGTDFDHNGFPDLAFVEDRSCGLFCSKNFLQAWKEASRPVGLTAFLASPRGGETWREGSVHTVDWYAGVPAGLAATATIELSTTGAGGPWTTLGAGLPNGGRFQFQVPAGSASSDAYVRIHLQAGSLQARASHPAPLRILP